MNWTPSYIEKSLYYEAWKTKYIEVFAREYAMLKRLYQKFNKTDLKEYINFTEYYISIFKTVLKILKNKLKSDKNPNTIFYKDVLFEANKASLINNLEIWFDAIDYIKLYEIDKNTCVNFHLKFLNILDDFRDNFKPLIKNTGNRNTDYIFYDNENILWGLDPIYYKKIINLFLKHENLKIVRICGSRVGDNFRDFSDIDLISEGTYSLQEFAQITNELHDLDCPYIIDINDIYKPNKPFIYRNTIRSNVFYRRSDYLDDNYTSILN